MFLKNDKLIKLKHNFHTGNQKTVGLSGIEAFEMRFGLNGCLFLAVLSLTVAVADVVVNGDAADGWYLGISFLLGGLVEADSISCTGCFFTLEVFNLQ